jgi:hypothetical protein
VYSELINFEGDELAYKSNQKTQRDKIILQNTAILLKFAVFNRQPNSYDGLPFVKLA